MSIQLLVYSLDPFLLILDTLNELEQPDFLLTEKQRLCSVYRKRAKKWFKACRKTDDTYVFFIYLIIKRLVFLTYLIINKNLIEMTD